MIAKIVRGTNIYGALVYNNTKVIENKGEILHLNNMRETRDGNYSSIQLMSTFVPYLVANKKTEKTALHISLNPDPKDIVSDEDFVKIADEYMQKLGYGEQPYVVFKHTDIARTHLHIVSTTVDQQGSKIPDSFEKKRSMDICRDLELKYNLIPATEKQDLTAELMFMPVDYTQTNVKNQIAAVVRYLPDYYQFQTLGSYNALLSLFNITAEHIKKEYKGELKEGLVYFALDKKGNKASNPFKSSLFAKSAGLKELHSHFQNSKENSYSAKTLLIDILTHSLKVNTIEEKFKEYLIKRGINTIIRKNELGRIYGITFIDHNTKNVFNGSQLGKQFSANAFQELFSITQQNEIKIGEVFLKPGVIPLQTVIKTDLHPFFDFMVNQSNLGDFGFLDSLLLGNFTEDSEEQAFEQNMKKKRKKRNT